MTRSAWHNFSLEELECHCGCGVAGMDPEFMQKLVLMRRDLGFAFKLSSAYRCPDYNERISHTGRTGPHTTGRAVDIVLAGAEAFKVVSNSVQYGFTGIGIKQHGSHAQRFIHLDDLTGDLRPWVWSYA